MHRSTIDHSRFSSHRGLNRLQTMLLLGLMTGYAGFLGWMLWGADGLWLILAWAAALVLFSPGMSARWVLRMYSARPIYTQQGDQLHHVVAVLAQRAGLPRPPSLWWVPSPMINAFAVGRQRESAIAMTDGLLRTLAPRELIAVLAHEIAHIAHGDLLVMSLADTISRITSAMSFTGLLLILFSLPQAVAGSQVDWWPLLLLAIAPQVSLLAQLGLSRTREFDADLSAAQLTNDPEALASALIKLERVQQGFLRRIFFPGRGLPEPSWLRTHPTTEERVRRLRDLTPQSGTDWFGEYRFDPPIFPHVRLRQRPWGGYWGYWY